MSTFSIRLKELRKQRGITLEKMAKDLGTTKATLSRYENSIRDPKTEITNTFSKYFDVSVDYLVGNTDDPNTKILTKEDLPIEWIRAGIESMTVFKGLNVSDLTLQDLRDILEAIDKVKKRHT
jgi:transcriptional regulator with XRE-family HTH domain